MHYNVFLLFELHNALHYDDDDFLYLQLHAIKLPLVFSAFEYSYKDDFTKYISPENHTQKTTHKKNHAKNDTKNPRAKKPIAKNQ